MRELWRKFQHWMHRAEFEKELEEEMNHHLALSAEDRGNVYAAKRQFGNTTLLKEESRAMWNWSLFEQLLQDLRYGFRTMAANPLFSAIAALSLALGIGANTAIFSFMDAVLLRTLPVKSPRELVVFHWRDKGRSRVPHGITGSMFRDGAKGRTSPNFPYASVQVMRDSSDVVSTVFAYAIAWRLNIVAEKQATFSDGQ